MARGFTAAAGNYLATTSSPSDTNWTGALSVSIHAYILSTGAYEHFLGKHAGNGGSANPVDFRTDNGGPQLLNLVRANGGDFRVWQGPATTASAWKVYGFSAPSSIESAMNFYIDGAKTAGTNVLGSGTGAPTGSTAEIRVGRRADGAVQMDGYLGELGVWNVELTDAEHAVLGKGYSPLLIRPSSLIFYLPLVRDADQDIKGGLAFTATNTPTVQNHPRVIYPRRKQVVVASAGAPAGVFAPYYYREHIARAG